jgi:hypothetical protein
MINENLYFKITQKSYTYTDIKQQFLKYYKILYLEIIEKFLDNFIKFKWKKKSFVKI